jgi:hypothetical protein
MTTKINIKKAILALLLMVSATLCFAQCDKATLTASKTVYIDDKGNVLKTKDETTIITITKTELTIVPGDEDHKVSGAIVSKECKWNVPFKEGKTVLKSTLTDVNGENQKHVTVSIEGKGGKVTLTFEADEMPGKKIQVVADKFE